MATALRLAFRFSEGIKEIRACAFDKKKRAKHKLNTQVGRDKLLEAIVNQYNLWGTSIENYFRLKAMCMLKRKENPVV